MLENFVYGDTPEPEALNDLLSAILREEERFSLSVYETSSMYDIRLLVVNTLLTYLELEKIIESTGPFYTSYKFTPHRPSQEILGRFDAERAGFLRSMFSCARKGQKWFALDLDEAVEKTASSRERVVAALNYLEEQGDLELQAAGLRRGFRIVKRPGTGEIETLAARLLDRFQAREKNDIKRLGQVISLVCYKGCQTKYLLNYFGEQHSENCGHCENCLSGKDDDPVAAEMFFSNAPTITDDLRNRVRAVLAEGHESLTSPRQQARFFCGIRSPKASRAKLHQHAAFGILKHISFPEVLSCLDNLGLSRSDLE